MSTFDAECCALNAGPLATDDAERYARLFKVLAEPTRLRLLSHLAAEGCGPVSVNELTNSLGLSQPTVSHHLKKLSEAGLLEKVRRGRTITHEVRTEAFTSLRRVLELG